MARVCGDADTSLVPAMSGAAISAHSENSDWYSACVMPPLPTSSMSGSFQDPGRAYFASWEFLATIVAMLVHVSRMSGVVRQRLAIRPPHCHGWTSGYSPSHMLSSIVRPVLFSALATRL